MSARSLNRVQLIGNLTRDPELRYTPQGTAVCTIGLATNRTWVPSDGGERQEETEYHRIVAWAKLAEICSQLLYKGRKIYIEGRLQTRKWTGQDNLEREVTEVVIDNMIALGSPKGKSFGDDESSDYEYAPVDAGSNSGQAPAATTATQQQSSDTQPKKDEAPKKVSKKEEIDTDDIPF